MQPYKKHIGVGLVLLSLLLMPSAYALPDIGDATQVFNTYLASKPASYRTKILDALWQLESRIDADDVNEDSSFLHALRRNLDARGLKTDTVIHDGHLGITFTQIREIDLVYLPENTIPMHTLFREMYDVVANASYFSRKESAKTHAGLLYYNKKFIAPFVSNDPNITHVICLSRDGTFRLIENADFFSELVYDCDVAFQAGPLLLGGSAIYPELSASTFDQSKHTRTLLMQSGQQGWIVTVRSELSLWQIITYVRHMAEFRDQNIDLINLDGGSSVVYRSNLDANLDYGTHKILPLFFGINTP